MDGRDHLRRAIRHYLEKDEDLSENPQDQKALDASIKSAFVLARAAVSAARDIRDMVLRLPPGAAGRASELHRHYDAVWAFLSALWELIDFCELEQEVASSEVSDQVWFFGKALDQQLGGNPFEALAILDEAGLAREKDPWVQTLRAEALAAVGEQTEAIRAWEEATHLDQRLGLAHVGLAGELEALGRDREAYEHWVALCQSSGRDDPVAAEARRHMARLRQRLAKRPPPESEPQTQSRLPRWGPSWVPSWPQPSAGAGLGPTSGEAPGTGETTAGGETTASGEATGVVEAAAAEATPVSRTVFGRLRPNHPSRLSTLLGLSGPKDLELVVFVAGADPISEGLIRSRGAAYMAGGLVIGVDEGVWDPGVAELEEADVIILSSGTSLEQCAAFADRAREGLLCTQDGPPRFIYNGPSANAGSLKVIFEGLDLEIVPDINPRPREEEEDVLPASNAGMPLEGGIPEDTGDPLLPTLRAVERLVAEKLGGARAPRVALSKAAVSLPPVLGWLDTTGRRNTTRRTPAYELIAVNAQPKMVEAVAVRGGVATGFTFGPGGDDRGRLLEELFDEMPQVLGPGDMALLMGRLLGEGGFAPVAPGPESFVATSLAAGVLSRAMAGLRRALASDAPCGLRSHHVLVGGTLVSRLPSPEHALLAAIDGCQPTGVTRILLDPHGIVTSLGEGLVSGRLSPDDPSLSDGTAALLAGSCLCVAPLVQAVKWGKPGRHLVLEATVKGAWRDGERTWQLCRGELIWIPLPAGRRVEVEVRPAAPYNVGKGRGAAWRGEFVAGGLGLLLDGRGRPLRLPASEPGRTTIRAAWASEILGKGKGA